MIYPFCRIIDAYGIWEFMKNRVVPRERDGIEEILEAYGMKEYDATELTKKTHGGNV